MSFSGTSAHFTPLGCGENQIRVWASLSFGPDSVLGTKIKIAFLGGRGEKRGLCSFPDLLFPRGKGAE